MDLKSLLVEPDVHTIAKQTAAHLQMPMRKWVEMIILNEARKLGFTVAGENNE